MTAPGPLISPAVPSAATAATAASGVEAPSTSATFAARLASRAPPSPGSETGAPDSLQPPGEHALLAEARDFIEAVRRDRAVIDAAVARVTEGQALTAGELLALQTRVYRFGQQVDLAAKVVEKSVGTVRRVIDLQV